MAENYAKTTVNSTSDKVSALGQLQRPRILVSPVHLLSPPNSLSDADVTHVELLEVHQNLTTRVLRLLRHLDTSYYESISHRVQRISSTCL